MLNLQNTQGESRDPQSSPTKRNTSTQKRGRNPHRDSHHRPKEPAAQ